MLLKKIRSVGLWDRKEANSDNENLKKKFEVEMDILKTNLHLGGDLRHSFLLA